MFTYTLTLILALAVLFGLFKWQGYTLDPLTCLGLIFVAAIFALVLQHAALFTVIAFGISALLIARLLWAYREPRTAAQPEAPAA